MSKVERPSRKEKSSLARKGNRVNRAASPADDSTDIPRHIAIIMDGNGRWAKGRGLPRVEGHREGVKSAREIVRVCGELGVGVLTLYTFSTENWNRPRTEVEALMSLLALTLRQEIKNLMDNNVRLQVIGRLSDLAPGTRKALTEGMASTAANSGLILILAISYGGRQEIVDAVNRLMESGTRDITEADFARQLYTADLPDPDLIVRTSGEMRLSNFLLWQSAYSELVVTETLWPDFRKPQLLAAIEEYGRRRRRFGQVAEIRERR